MGFHESAADGESETHAVGLGRLKRFEESSGDGFRDAGAGIGDANQNGFGIGSDANAEVF